MHFRILTLATLTLAAAAGPARACSVCGCSLSSDWAAQGYVMAPGLNVDLRFEYYEQNDLRSGTGSVDRSALTFPNDEEIQQRTVNRNTWLNLSYVLNPHWAVAASLPWHDRFHTTIAEGDTDISTSDASGFGDLRLTTRYQQSSPGESFGLQFGLKLPTGRFDQTFASGPQTGEQVDRGLQLGTGTWDLLAGASWFARPTSDFGCFFQATLDAPLAERQQFMPSTSVTFSTGVRWLNPSRFTPQFQVNAKFEGREHGAEADTDNSGGTLVYASPGVTVELGGRASGFVFVQLPLLQRVNGLQLEPRWILSTGVRWNW
ncbi:MAG TPA: transporter [Candidatus Didemnitutus sp.]|nr:transporter [Candidatus Didemnitutus sp.]